MSVFHPLTDVQPKVCYRPIADIRQRHILLAMAEPKTRAYLTLFWISNAVIVVWLVLWIAAVTGLASIDVSNKRTIPWTIPAVAGSLLFGWLSRRTADRSQAE
jgi:hypothetical protein